MCALPFPPVALPKASYKFSAKLTSLIRAAFAKLEKRSSEKKQKKGRLTGKKQGFKMKHIELRALKKKKQKRALFSKNGALR